MSEGEKPQGMTIVISAPRVLAEAVALDRDPRTAEVLRALQRARGTVAKADEPAVARTPEKAIAGLQNEIRALREDLSKATSQLDEMAQRLASSSRVLERSVVVPSEKLADFQRAHDGAAREIRDAAQELRRQTATLAAWRAWWTRQVTLWGVVLAIVIVAGTAFVWRAHSLAQSTHDVLLQILENQAKAQTGKGAKR